jgi:hypothetical protein
MRELEFTGQRELPTKEFFHPGILNGRKASQEAPISMELSNSVATVEVAQRPFCSLDTLLHQRERCLQKGQDVDVN